MSTSKNVTDEVKCLSTALADLHDEKRRSRAEKDQSDEALRRKRERYQRGLNDIAQMKNKLSRAREEFEAEKSKTEAAAEKMNVTVESNNAIKREIERLDLSLEERRNIWRKESDEQMDVMEKLYEEMGKKREANKKENVESRIRQIEREMAENGFEKVGEEVEAYEEDEKAAGNRDEDAVVALRAVDAIVAGILGLEKEGKVVGEIADSAAKFVRRLGTNDDLPN